MAYQQYPKMSRSEMHLSAGGAAIVVEVAMRGQGNAQDSTEVRFLNDVDEEVLSGELVAKGRIERGDLAKVLRLAADMIETLDPECKVEA